jgi:large subunit ribosomal protein L25
MSHISLNAAVREKKGSKVKEILKVGEIPGILYGKGIENKIIKVAIKDFTPIFDKGGYSTLIDLKINDDEPKKVLIKDVQYDPVTKEIIHIDFHCVKMDEPIEVEIPINFIGESPAVKKFGAILIKNISEITIKCLPDKLIHSIDIDLSKLVDVDTYVFVKDLSLPESAQVINSPDLVVVGALRKRGTAVKEKSEAEEEVVVEKPAGSDTETNSADKSTTTQK